MLFLFYFVLMKKNILCSVGLLFFFHCMAQDEPVPFIKEAMKENRAKEYRNLVSNTINKNLALPLTDSTEDKWEAAFAALQYINHRSLWVYGRVKLAFFDSLENRSIVF
jgi:hypothetical protein